MRSFYTCLSSHFEHGCVLRNVMHIMFSYVNGHNDNKPADFYIGHSMFRQGFVCPIEGDFPIEQCAFPVEYGVSKICNLAYNPSMFYLGFMMDMSWNDHAWIGL